MSKIYQADPAIHSWSVCYLPCHSQSHLQLTSMRKNNTWIHENVLNVNWACSKDAYMRNANKSHRYYNTMTKTTVTQVKTSVLFLYIITVYYYWLLTNSRYESHVKTVQVSMILLSIFGDKLKQQFAVGVNVESRRQNKVKWIFTFEI